jgi:hypothetical protein
MTDKPSIKEQHKTTRFITRSTPLFGIALPRTAHLACGIIRTRDGGRSQKF